MALKKMLFTLKEYEERNKKLEAQVQKYQTELYGKSADKYASIGVYLIFMRKKLEFLKKDIQNDPILKELQDQLKNIDSELTEMVVFIKKFH